MPAAENNGNDIDESACIVTIHPLADMCPRGSTPEHGAELATELFNDPKEIAEHVMLIDLARNGIGRTAEIGSVKVTDQMVIEKYSYVQYIVSSVEGCLRPGMINMDALHATSPAGMLSGAPRVCATEIIDELEPARRGIYGSAAGYLSFLGEMDLAIAIRTGIIKDGNFYVQVTAGVMVDSDPDVEWREAEHKVRAVLRVAK